jgi:hypothetical protein
LEADVGLAEVVKKKVDPRAKLTQEQFKKARPLRNPAAEWTVAEDGSVLVEAPLTELGKGMVGWVARRMKMPSTKKFELEPVGGFLWQLFDGKHNVETIGRKLRQEFKMNRVEADASLSAFLQMLNSRKLITLLVGKEG